MGITVTDVRVTNEISSLIDGSTQTNIDAFVEEIYHGFETTNNCVLDVMTDWHEFLRLLEQNPKNYKSMCRDGDVERAITGLEEAGRTLRKESWIQLGKKIKKHLPKMHEKFQTVDENIEAFGALLQEVSWTLLILHRENQASTGRSLSIDEAVADLRS